MTEKSGSGRDREREKIERDLEQQQNKKMSILPARQSMYKAIYIFHVGVF